MPPPVPSLNWVLIAGRAEDDPRPPLRASLMINNVYGMLRAAERGLGVASLPDYLCSTSRRLVRVLPDLEGPTFDAYFVYPEEMRASKRVSSTTKSNHQRGYFCRKTSIRTVGRKTIPKPVYWTVACPSC